VSYALHTTYYPASSLLWCILYPPASFSFLSSPSFALSAGHSAIVGNDVAGMGLVVELHALLRLVVPGLCMPLVYAVLSSAILLHVGVYLT
jgi:hypothetical protein